MAKLLLRGEYFESISANAWFESDYENLLLAHAEFLYPTFHLVRFKCDVASEFGTARPDLALIDKNYRKWWVVEVELASHSLDDHVEPQVRILANGAYNRRHAEVLSRNDSALDSARISDMVLGAQPRVLVIVNSVEAGWQLSLRRWDALIGVIEVFRSERGVEVLRMNGDHPERIDDVHLSVCRVDPLLKRSLIVDSPASLGIVAGGKLSIWFENGITEWMRVDAANRVWLMPTRRWPLPSKALVFNLMGDGTGQMRLVAV